MIAEKTEGISMSLKYRTLLAKMIIPAMVALMACPIAQADDVSDKDRMLCATSKVLLCVEDGQCFPISILDAVDIPQFLIIDTKKELITTTVASGENRESPVANLSRQGGRIFLQSVENNRAYSILIEEESGRFSAAIASDGITLSVFGACTDADID